MHKLVRPIARHAPLESLHLQGAPIAQLAMQVRCQINPGVRAPPAKAELLPQLARPSVRLALQADSPVLGAPIAHLAMQISMRQLKVRSACRASQVRCQMLTRVRASHAKAVLMLLRAAANAQHAMVANMGTGFGKN